MMEVKRFGAHLGNLSKGATLLSEVDDNTASTILCLLDCLLDAKNEVRSASTNIGPKNVTAIALIRLAGRTHTPWRICRTSS